MITIRIARAGRKVTAEIKGHANAAARGEDVICAGVSTLVLTLACALHRKGAAGFSCRLNEGDARIEFEKNRASKPILFTVLRGFEFLADSYPQYIRLQDETKRA